MSRLASVDGGRVGDGCRRRGWLVAPQRVRRFGPRRLPNWLTLPGALLVLMVVAALPAVGPAALAGAAALSAPLPTVHAASPRAMGGGDVEARSPGSAR